MKTHRKDIVLEKVPGGPVPALVYDGSDGKKSAPIVLYLHGGAFLGADGNGERPVAASLAEAGAIVLAPDYCSSSCGAFPQVLEHAFALLTYLSDKRKNFGSTKSLLFVAGEEAGGNVAAGAALKARDQIPGELDGQILVSPLLDPFMGTKSFRKAEEIGMRQRWSEGWNHYLGSMGGVCHPYAAPAYCSRLTGLAPALILTSDDDPLRDETVGYAARLSTAGVVVRQHVFPAGTGWPSLYGGKSCGDGKWCGEIRDHFGSFVRELQTQTISN